MVTLIANLLGPVIFLRVMGSYDLEPLSDLRREDGETALKIVTRNFMVFLQELDDSLFTAHKMI